MASVVLLAFALALTLTQVSCSKSTAQSNGTPTSATPIGLILYQGDDNNSANVNFYVCNYDGSNAHQIPVPSLPSGFAILEGGKLSPDGKTLFFLGRDMNQTNPGGTGVTYKTYLYSVGVDGSSLKQLTAVPANTSYDAEILGAY